jgi:transposase
LTPEDALTLVAAGRRFGVAVESLRILADSGRVRCLERRTHGRGVSVTFSAAQLSDDLDGLPQCRAPSCDRPGTGPSGYCGEHFSQGGRERARDAEDDLFASKRDWWSVTEATNRAGGRVSRTRIQQAAERGEFPSEKVGRIRRIPRQPFLAWLKAQPRGPSKPSRDESEALGQRVVELFGEGLAIGEIAKKVGHSRQAVSAWLDRAGIERPGRGRGSRKLPPDERSIREQRAAELYGGGMSSRDVAQEVGSSQSQVLRDLRDVDEEIRPPGSHPKYPEPVERACAWCGRTFKPKYGSWDTRGGQPKPRRFHNDECAHAWRAAQARAALKAGETGELYSTEKAGEELGLGAHRVLDLIDRGHLRSERLTYPGMLRPVNGIAPAEIRRFMREWALGGDGRRAAALDPDVAVARAERDGRIDRLIGKVGFSRDDARQWIRDRAERRRGDLAQRRKGPPPAGPSARAKRWAARYRELAQEREYHRDQLKLGAVDPGDGARYEEAIAGKRRSDRSLARQIAVEDWTSHPEDWDRDDYPAAPRDPAAMHPDWLRLAEDLVRSSLKRLQTAGTQKHPG